MRVLLDTNILLNWLCAENAELDFIVTENLKDFENSKIPAIDISSALEKI